MRSPFDNVVVRRTGLIVAVAAVLAIAATAAHGSGGSGLRPATWLSLGGCVLAARSAVVVTRRWFRRELAGPVGQPGRGPADHSGRRHT